MKQLKFGLIGNVQGIPDYREWSVLRAKPESVNTVKQAPASRELRIRVRTQCAHDMAMKYGYTDTAEDIFGQDPVDFEKWAINDHSVPERIAKRIGLQKTLNRVQVQRPGQMVMPHRDDLAVSYLGEVSEIEHYYTVSLDEEDKKRFAQNPLSAMRVLIMLEDWRIGQGFATEQGTISNWKRGDVYAWDWTTEVHATFNCGYWSRPLLRMSGMTTEVWDNLLRRDMNFTLKY